MRGHDRLVDSIEDAGYVVEDLDLSDYLYVSHPFGDLDNRDLDDIVDLIHDEGYRTTNPRIVGGEAKIMISQRKPMRDPWTTYAPGVPISHFR